MNRFTGFLFRILVVIALFSWIGQQVNIQEMRDSIQGIDWIPFGMAFVLVGLNRYLVAYKWYIILKYHEADVTLGQLFRITMTSQFLGFAIPSGFGVDAVRFLHLQRDQKNFTISASSIIADRMLGVLSIVMLALLGVAMAYQDLPDPRIMQAVIGISSLVGIGVLGLMWKPVFHVYCSLHHFCGKGLFAPFIPWKNRDIWQSRYTQSATKLGELQDCLHHLAVSPGLLLRLAGYNLLVQLSRVVQVVLLYQAFNTVVPLSLALAFVPIIILIVLLPISISGLGVIDSAFVYFFSHAGIATEASLSVSLSSHLLKLFLILWGGLFFLKGEK